jgi:hypothetical protein
MLCPPKLISVTLTALRIKTAPYCPHRLLNPWTRLLSAGRGAQSSMSQKAVLYKCSRISCFLSALAAKPGDSWWHTVAWFLFLLFTGQFLNLFGVSEGWYSLKGGRGILIVWMMFWAVFVWKPWNYTE